MLQLQRASAGSGKTYLLAKKFIWYFITIEYNGKRRLRKLAEMGDSLSHILAITFTNKATAEMKHRIVSKLAAIAAYNPGGKTKSPDYLDDFVKESGRKPEDIVALAKKGLSILLNYYSDFNVSTIDSFFQSVLRTFAYEADLNDSYEVELDNKYLATVAIDGLLDEIRKKTSDNKANFWVEMLMKRASGSAWNIFSRNPGENRNTLYGKMLNAAESLDNEEYKEIRGELDDYFDKHPDLITLYKTLEERYGAVMKGAAENLRKAAMKFADLWTQLGLDVSEHGARYLDSHISKCLSVKWTPEQSLSKLKKPVSFKPIKLDGRILKAKFKLPTEIEETLRQGCREMYDAVEEYLNTITSSEMSSWRLYRMLFPYMALQKLLRDKRLEYLEENNMVELAETNSMLRDIIGDSDVPFIYERLGTKLHHFLIDEFQDTSKMQWHNLSKLVMESESHEYSNLIIGDAKQSIYRFRNADPTLISDVVPKSIANIQISGMTEAENANWRSRPEVVKFNNFVFERLAAHLSSPVRMDYSALYANVCQKPMSSASGGYVEFRIYEAGKTDTLMAHETSDIVEELLARGCRQSDIAVLVSRQKEAEAVIASFVKVNNLRRQNNLPQINFIGEQTLRIASSKSVGIIISALGALSEGRMPEFRSGEERHRKGAADWDDIKCNFRFYSLMHPEMTMAERVETFLKEESAENVLSNIVAGMHSVSLPALVEAISEAFVPQEYRESEALFISSFQDVVLQYCSRFSADISSFLLWWNNNRTSLSISVSEDIDAVRVMTIHKSKGLEFKYVVLPEVTQIFGSVPAEWLWVVPEKLSIAEGLVLPPYLPVIASEQDIMMTSHYSLANQRRDMSDMDLINRLYVAFTRAADELYILSERPSAGDESSSVGLLIENFITEEEPESEYNQEAPDYTVISDENCTIYYIGEQAAPEAGVAEADAAIIPQYYVNSDRKLLHYREETTTLHTDDEEEDPRAEGTFLHDIMAQVEIREDLDRAFMQARVRGLVTRSEADSYKNMLSEALDMPEVREWFDGSMKVCNERSIISNGRPTMRPDRLMIDEENNLVIVDYKFGSSKSHSKYVKQLKDYAASLNQSKRYRSITTYIWYVAEKRISQVSEVV